MCMVSNSGDWWQKQSPVQPLQPLQPFTNDWTWLLGKQGPTQEEFDELKKKVEQMSEQLKKAKIFDEETGQKDCENEEKLAKLRQIAKIIMGEDYELPV